VRWIIIEEKHLTQINLGFEKKTLQQVKTNVDMDLIVSH
jgi:hypothetical protein